jgi:hypothetical protein
MLAVVSWLWFLSGLHVLNKLYTYIRASRKASENVQARMVFWSPMDVTEMARMGGKARAEAMTAEQRSDNARAAVNARWAKAKAATKKAAKKESAKKKAGGKE